jgi:cysteine-rich repeat protein
MIRALVIVALASGCVSSETTLCDDGDARCPEGTVCVAITFTNAEVEATCVQPDQRTSCAALDDGTQCLVGMAAGTCHDHVCLADECGNRLVDFGEVCDDGDTIAGDGCSVTCVSNETCGNGVVDLIVGESCDDGDWLSHDGCASGCAAESPTWMQLEDARPAPRPGAALVYDVARRRVVLFGGGQIPTVFGDTSEWNGRRWSRPQALTEPPARSGHAMAYDSARGQIVMFGGNTARETWLRDREGTWSLATSTDRPPYVTAASMVYDAGRKRVVMFGGVSADGVLDTTWIWSGATWTELLTEPRPPGRYRAAMAYDPKRGVVVLSGGGRFIGTPLELDDLWELDGDTWVKREPAFRPAPRTGAAMTYDPLSERVVLVGGQVGAAADRKMWAWDGQAWTQLSEEAIAIAPDTGLFMHSITTDAARGRMVLMGTHGDLQEWNGTEWTIVDQGQAPAPRPSARCMHAAASDPLRREVVVFGGTLNDLAVTVFDDTWIWNGTWRQAAIAPAPSPRYGASLTFDVARREMVLFGGCRVVGGMTEALADTWVWSSGQWSPKLLPSSPPARCLHATGYDPGRGEVVMFGGAGNGGFLGDTWTWNGTTWTDRAPANPPSARFGAGMAYDPANAEIVLFGGNASTVSGETWTWSGQVWTLKMPSSFPAPRFVSALAWDATRRRIVLFAGNANTIASADVWEWDGANWTLIPTARPPVARSRHTLVSDLDGAGVLVIGGFPSLSTAPAPLDDIWRLSWDDGGVQELCTEADTDGDGRTRWDDPDCWSTLTPLCPPATSCDPLAPHCGDGLCNAELESCAACPTDCGECAMGCGNFACEATETMASCPGDCTP